MRTKALVFGLSVTLGCSSGSTAPSGGGHVGTCASACDRIASLDCPNDDRQECVSECEADGAEALVSCPNEYGRALGCAEQIPLVCGAYGTAIAADEDALYTTCADELAALAGCSTCLPDTEDDTACDVCSKQNCCEERRGAVGDPAMFLYLQCVQACEDSSCYETCSAKFPTLVTRAQALADCEAGRCGAACG